jgi:inorganic pyrophosphatase
MFKNISDKKGFIFDIDGTLTYDGKCLPGAIELIETLRNRGATLRFATNGTGKSPEEIADQLNDIGFTVEAKEVETSVTACLSLLKTRYQKQSGRLLLPKRTHQQFANIESQDTNPDYIVLGDIDDQFTNRLMNALFNQIREGAQLIVFHRNLYFHYGGQYHLDSGAYTLALEQATQSQAIVTGKPSSIFFDEIVKGMELEKQDVVVIGDDLSTDILGANYSAIDSILVETGKYAAGLRHEQAKPTWQLHSLRELTK